MESPNIPSPRKCTVEKRDDEEPEISGDNIGSDCVVGSRERCKSLRGFTISLDKCDDFVLYIKYDEDGQAEEASEREVEPFDCTQTHICRAQISRTVGRQSPFIRQ